MRPARGVVGSIAWLALTVTAIGDPTAVADDRVERRGTESPLTGSITQIDDAGVTLATERGVSRLVPWDRVRHVEAEPRPAGLERWSAIAVDLWRARSRLERGDTVLAEPIFERLFFDEYRGRTHVTARLVAEGLARCLLAHGANARAVIPVLETVRLERAGVGRDVLASLPPFVDAETSLCPQLAPAWVASRALPKLEADLLAYDTQGDPVVADLAALYLAAVRGRRGTMDDADDPVALELCASEHAGVAFLALFVETAAPDADRRDAARRALSRALDERPPWAEGWARFAIGSSLARESGVGRAQRGIVQLVHLPARFRSRLPFLTGLALALAAEVSREQGDEAAAAVFLAELRRWFPNHPVVTTGSVVSWNPPAEDLRR